LKQESQTGENPTTDTSTGLEDATGLQALLTPKGVLDFTSGIIYGTGLVKNTTYLDKCINIVHYDFIKNSEVVVNKTLSVEPFQALYASYDILYAAHPLIVNCM